ncbi:MAG: hypothetical protein DMF87_05300 [Acidobacteria bacterium]|nr:MAG: hypothetical protein DMF87_05300 [Acidobacteriota bacterium]
MVPISRRKQAAGIVGAFVIGYALSWLSAPGAGTGPVDSFSPTFGASASPIIVSPAAAAGERSIEASEPQISSPTALQRSANEPI